MAQYLTPTERLQVSPNDVEALKARIRELESDLIRHQNEVQYQTRRADGATTRFGTLYGFLIDGKLQKTRKLAEADQEAWVAAVRA